MNSILEIIMNDQKRMFWIKFAYWLGIAADALWAIALFVPSVFGMLTGNPGFDPGLDIRLIMGIGGSLMTGWTFLLIWAVRKPVERRMVILLTAFQVVFGLFIISLLGLLDGTSGNIWLIAKTMILMISMTVSYILAGKMNGN